MEVQLLHPSSADLTKSILCTAVENGSHGWIVACGMDEGGIVDIIDLATKATVRSLLPEVSGQSSSSAVCNSICFSKHNDDILYCSCDHQMIKYDLRQAKPTCCNFNYNLEEINQIDVNYNESSLAACDDDGQIVIVDLQNGQVRTKLSHHSNICSSIQFLPHASSKLISVGLDCLIHYYDFLQCNPLLHSINVQDITPNTSTINPPFIHHLDIASNTGQIACATNDSNVYMFEVDCEDNELYQTHCFSGHNLCANQSHFAKWQSMNSLLTAGNDGNVLIWELLDEANDQDQTTTALPLPASINHGRKVNWISSFETAAPSMIVCDVSSSVTVYSNISH